MAENNSTGKGSSLQAGYDDDADDPSIQEETTLGACLKRILEKDKNTTRDAETTQGARPKEQARLHCIRYGGCKKLSSKSPNVGMYQEQKLQKWREAGAALRKVLAETAQEKEKPSGEDEMPFRSCDKTWKSTSPDPMNAMLDDYKSQENETLPNTKSDRSNHDRLNKFGHRDYRKILEEHFSRRKAEGGMEDRKLTPGLLSVREKIREITSRINETVNPKHNKKPQHGANKNPTPRRLSRAPSRNPSQEMVSSESDGETEASRHKFVPKCRRTSSTGSPKPRNKCSKDGENSLSGQSGRDDGPQYHLLLASSSDEAMVSQAQPEEKLDLTHAQPEISDGEADAIAQKLQELVRKHQHGQQQQRHVHPSVQKPKIPLPGIKRLSAIEADSLPNLADIESSPVTDDPGCINNESENEVFLPGGQRDPDGLRLDRDNIMCSSCGSEVSDIQWFEGRRNSGKFLGTSSLGHLLNSVPDNMEISKGKTSPHVCRNSSDSEAEDENFSPPDDFPDLAVLDLQQHSNQSEQEDDSVHLNSRDLEKLPILVSDDSSSGHNCPGVSSGMEEDIDCSEASQVVEEGMKEDTKEEMKEEMKEETKEEKVEEEKEKEEKVKEEEEKDKEEKKDKEEEKEEDLEKEEKVKEEEECDIDLSMLPDMVSDIILETDNNDVHLNLSHETDMIAREIWKIPQLVTSFTLQSCPDSEDKHSHTKSNCRENKMSLLKSGSNESNDSSQGALDLETDSTRLSSVNSKKEDYPGVTPTYPVINSSSCGLSDQDAEADDEFECDCSVCQLTRRGQIGEWLTDEEELHGHLDDSNHIEYAADGEDRYSINLAELTPLDLLLMREGRRELLELMFQNVIMQMLSVYPDLLGEQAPPPASPNTIQNLTTLKLEKTHTDKDNICPICLCNFEVGEEAHRLPCHHVFHTLCIQAWLSKSGTCPVCRHTLIGKSESK